MKWEKIEFGELYLIPSKNGLNRPSRVRGSGYKMINMGELFANDRIKDIPMELVPLNDREIESSNILEQDLLFARQSIVASGAGKCSIVLEVPEITTFESHLIRVRLNSDRANPLFYYYYFKTPFANMKSLVQQGVQAGIRGSELKNLNVFYPPLPTQRKIASTLSAYDDLIENNLKRIKLLEEKAFLRYKQIMREEKMERKKLKDVLELMYGKALKADDRKEGKYPVYGSSGEVGSHEEFLIEGPGIIVGRKGNIGSVFWSDENFWPIDTVYYVESDLSFHFLYFNLKEQHFVNTDAAVPGLNRSFALDNLIDVPSMHVIEDFNKVVIPIFKLMNVLRKQNTRLQEARDILLPKLMNGQIEV